MPALAVIDLLVKGTRRCCVTIVRLLSARWEREGSVIPPLSVLILGDVFCAAVGLVGLNFRRRPPPLLTTLLSLATADDGLASTVLGGVGQAARSFVRDIVYIKFLCTPHSLAKMRRLDVDFS